MTREKKYGIAGSFLINTSIVLILLFTYISLSNPVSSEGGILINFGDMESAGGSFEPELNNAPVTQQAIDQSRPTETEEGLMTQDYEEAPSMKAPSTEKKTETKPAQPKPEPEPPKPVINETAMWPRPGQSTTESGSSEGISSGSGNMGDLSGTTESDNFAEGLGGNGIAYLEGRNPLHLQKPEFPIREEGKIVVEIRVDQTGKVISANPGIKGSTTLNRILLEAAKKAALESKFDTKENAPVQIGTITYYFKLQ